MLSLWLVVYFIYCLFCFAIPYSSKCLTVLYALMFVLNGCDFIWCCHTCICVLPNLAFGYCFSQVYVESQEQNSVVVIFSFSSKYSCFPNPSIFYQSFKKNYLIGYFFVFVLKIKIMRP